MTLTPWSSKMSGMTTNDIEWGSKSYLLPSTPQSTWFYRESVLPPTEIPSELQDWPGPESEEIPGLLDSLKPGAMVPVMLRGGQTGSMFLVPGFDGLAIASASPDWETRFVHARSGKDLSSPEESPFDVVGVWTP